VLLLFSCTLFLSAALLFLVQPMFGKMVLPLLGGTPEVWNTCMVFYQAVLLAGYAYAHAATRWLGVRRHLALHALLLFLPLALLPIAVPEGASPPRDTLPIGWLLGLLAVSVGLPLFVVSSTAPLVQRWFSETGHPAAGDPYFLYAASNLGSMLALVSFPLVLEPTLRLATQSWVWAAGYAALIVLILACAACVWRSRRGTGVSPVKPSDIDRLSPAKHRRDAGATVARKHRRDAGIAAGQDRVTGKRRLQWLALAFVPSSWMLGVTAHMTTDIAPVPLLWVVPLALYLLSFILVFARRPLVSHRKLAPLVPAALLLLVISILFPATWQVMALHLAAFFLGAVVCHGELAGDRPPAEDLTEFYLWMSVGGVLGGVFNGLVAPVVFPWMLEYPLTLALACALLPAAAEQPSRWWRIGLLGAVTALAALWAGRFQTERPLPLVQALLIGIPVLMLLYLANRPRWFAAALALLLVFDRIAAPFSGEVLITARGYFGIHRVLANADEQYRYHHLVHGSTVHGRQCRNAGRQCEPLTYYARSGPLGQVFGALEDRPSQRVAVVGLGTGAMGCYRTPRSEFTFYEIDPIVQRVAETPGFFSFLSECAGQYKIVLGDGRLRLAEAADAGYEVIIFDAFSSDAVPVHLLTCEAIDLYLQKLAPGGLLVFHTTNNHLDLDAVLADLAGSAGLECRVCHDLDVSPAEFALGKAQSSYVALGRKPEDFGPLGTDPRWRALSARPGVAPWTDDFSNIVRVLKW
jgi:spermidine synthase